MIDAIISFVTGNPLLVLAIVYFVYKNWQSKQPWPDYGGSVVSVHSLGEWQELQKANSESLVMIDCYATWCPPCKAAAPVYAKMSEEYQGCTFAKMNVDEARDLGSKLGISAMPTFKLFRGDAELGAVQGFNQNAIRSLLTQHGATLASDKAS